MNLKCGLKKKEFQTHKIERGSQIASNVALIDGHKESAHALVKIK